MRHLSGLIYEPSMADRGVASWIASLAAGRARHSAPPASGWAQQIRETCGPKFCESSRRFVLTSFSGRTSAGLPGILMDSDVQSETSRELVTELRRLSSQRRTWAQAMSVSGPSSSPWITPRVANIKGSMQRLEQGSNESVQSQAETWPTPQTADENLGRVGDPQKYAERHKNREAASRNLAVDAALWLTPDVPNGGRGLRSDLTGKMEDGRKAQVGLHNQAGLWPTAAAWDGARGVPLTDRKDGKSREADQLDRAAVNWPTPCAAESDVADLDRAVELRKARGEKFGFGPAMTLGMAVQQEQWATPQTPTGGPESAEQKQDRKRAAGLEVNGGGNLQAQTQHWPTPRSEDSESSGARHGRGVEDTLTAVSRTWATPNATDSEQAGGREQKSLTKDARTWPTPAGRDHKGADLATRHGGLSLAHFAETGERTRTGPPPLWPTSRSQDAKHQAATDYEMGRETGKDLLHVAAARMDSPSSPPAPPTSTGGESSSPRTRSCDRLTAYATCGNKRIEKLAAAALARLSRRNGFTARRLNARFVFWLMGWDWIPDPIDSGSPATGSSPSRPAMPSSSSLWRSRMAAALWSLTR